LELSLAAGADIERERKQLGKHWQQRLMRSRYEVEQARRQYQAVDPEHRLVARELERRWDEALRADEQLQSGHERFQQDSPEQLSDEERDQILAISQHLPTLWDAPTTTPEDRQAIARLLLEQVKVNIEGNSERVDVELRWSGGFVSRHTLRRPVQTYEQLSYYDELLSRIHSMLAENKSLGTIAKQLNDEGFTPPKRSSKFSAGILTRFLRERGIRTGVLPKSVRQQSHLDRDEWWLADLAAKLRMPIATLHRWQRVGWVTSRKVVAAGNRWAIFADADELRRLTQLRACPRGWPNPYPPELINPKPKPL
jgi:DNA-binding transcriptional MerR regulator